jgi:tetratricopeptide (TPR) repeat protein
VTAGRAAPFALVALALAVYSAGLSNDFIYDDHEVVQAQPGPRSAAEAARIFQEPHFPNLPYFRPVTRLTLLAQKTLHGDDPAPFHVFNAALAGIAAALAFTLLRTPAFGLGAARSAFAAAMFLLHPAASSCVYPISSGRETLMPAVWMLAGTICWLRAGARWRAGGYLAFALALFSKEQAVVMPLLFLLADGLRLSAAPPRSAAQWGLRYAPAAAIAGAYFAVRHVLFGGSEYVPGQLWGPLATALYGLQTVWTPFLDLHYEPPLKVWFSPWRTAAALAATAALAWAWKRRGPADRRIAWFWCGWFVAAPLASSNLLRQEAAFDERYIFLASLAPFALAAHAAPGRREWAVLLLAAGAVSVHRAGYFADDFTFSRQWLATDPASVNAEYNLGFSYARRGDHGQAAVHYRRALVLRPDYAYAHNNLGNALAAAGRFGEAEPHFLEAARLAPRYFDAQYNLGVALCRAGEFERGAEALRRALELKTESAPAWVNLGNALAARGETAAAGEAYLRARALAPESAEAHGNYANVLARAGRFDSAIGHYREALRLDPSFDEARRNLEAVLAAAGRQVER